MKQICLVFALSLFLGSFLTACTSDEGTLKKKAQELAEQKFSEDIKAEAVEGVPQSEVLQQAYIDFLHGKSEVEVSEVKLQDSTTATVATTVTTYPMKLRKTLLSVASKVTSDKTRRFNFANAVPLVATQMNAKGEVETQPYMVYKFQKQSDKWVPQP
jgi:hypothetical protein